MNNNLLDPDDKAAANRYAAGYIREWDLRLREWRRWFRKSKGRVYTKQEEDAFFSTVADLNDWVKDPDFGKPLDLSPIEIAEIKDALIGNPVLLRQFNQFLHKHQPVQILEEAY